MAERTFIFPNIEPTMAVIESLGFKLTEDNYGAYIYTKEIGGRTCRLGLFHETASWDISDNTWLEFRYDDTKFGRNVHASLSFPHVDGKYWYMGTRNVPTADQIKAAICGVFERKRTEAETKLREAYADYEAVKYLRWD